MKKSKKISLIVFIVIFVLFLVALFMFMTNIYPRIVLDKEIEKLSTLDLKKDTVDLTIKTNGKYGKVEKSIKEYLSTYATHIQSILSIINEEDFVNILSVENYKKDGKSFTKTKAYLEEIEKTLNDDFDTIINMTDKKEMLKFIDSSIGDKYINLYKKYMYDKNMLNDLKDLKKQLEETKKFVDNTIDIYEQVINLLSNNQDKWEIENDIILINDQNILNQYNEYINKL